MFTRMKVLGLALVFSNKVCHLGLQNSQKSPAKTTFFNTHLTVSESKICKGLK